MAQKQGSSSYASNVTQPVDLARIQPGGATLQHIAVSQAQQLNHTKEVKSSSSVNAEKGNKNNFYLKQQL